MIQKIVKARKDHECEGCNEGIKKGEKYELLEARVPKYKNGDDEAGQIGVEFLRYRTCFRCWEVQFDTCTGGCDFVLERDMDDHGAPTGNLVCTNCGTVKPAMQ